MVLKTKIYKAVTILVLSLHLWVKLIKQKLNFSKVISRQLTICEILK